MSAIRPIAFLLGTLAAILSAPTGQAQTFPKAGEVLRDSLGARVWQVGYRMTPTGYATLERSRDTQLSMWYAYWDSEGLNAPFEGEGGERWEVVMEKTSGPGDGWGAGAGPDGSGAGAGYGPSSPLSALTRTGDALAPFTLLAAGSLLAAAALALLARRGKDARDGR